MIFRLVLLLVVLSCFTPASMSKSDPSTGKVRVIWVGEILSTNKMVLDWIMAEPRFQLTKAVPCDIQVVGLENAVRFARIYLPRTYERLYQDTDVAIFHDFHPKVLPGGSIEWFREAVENGLGLCLMEFAYRVAGYAGMDVWPTLKIYKAFPAEFAINQIEAIYGRQYYKIAKHGPLVDLPGIEKYKMNWGWEGDLLPRQGTITWVVWKGRGTPALVSGTYGKGRVLQTDSGWDTVPRETKQNWRYVTDLAYNEVTFVAGLAFPDDVELTHRTREKFLRYKEEKSIAIMVMEFIEKFGASPFPFEKKMAEMNADYSRAERLYIDGEMEDSANIMEGLLDRFNSLNAEMTKAKDRAMLWIYVSEWLVVSGTSMACGFVLWSLMIKRRLYRETEITRSRSLRREWER